MKTHLNFATASLEESIGFYATLLNARPVKVQRDYALFITERPALELALDLHESVQPATDAHYGVYVETAAEVERSMNRLTAAGFATTIEREETCYYANQTKVWTNDPDGRRWEIYTVHQETEERDDASTTCCAAS